MICPLSTRLHPTTSLPTSYHISHSVLLLMSFFAKGDFKIKESWEQKPPPSQDASSRNKSKDSEKNRSLVNVGKYIVADPPTDFLDDEISKKVLKDLAYDMPPGSIKTDKSSYKKEEAPVRLPPKQKQTLPSHSQNDLLTLMAARLKSVEITCKSQREQIREKGQTLEKLRAENTFLKGYKEDATCEYEKMSELESENQELKKKIEEMEGYLKQYGLKWVGNKVEGKLEHQQMKKDLKKNNYRLPTEIDINTIARRVQQLNGGLHQEGMGTEVYQDHGVHKFRKSQPLPMGFFSNGLAIKGFRFFPYKSKQSLQILGDLIDGYFPYVLKGKFPNGVFLKVVDRVAEQYINQSSDEAITTFESREDRDFKPPSKQEFLNRLPKQVVKNGKVISIRGEIEKRLNGDSGREVKDEAEEEENQVYSKEEGVMVFKTQENSRLQAGLTTENEICTLKIRSEEGGVYILQLSKEEQVKEVYGWMRKVNRESFVLMSNFPRRSYESGEGESLEALGFFPNAMLHIHTPK